MIVPDNRLRATAGGLGGSWGRDGHAPAAPDAERQSSESIMKRKSTKIRPKCGCRLHLTGYEIERILRRHRCLPKRRADLTVIGDLARLEWQLIVVRNAMGGIPERPPLSQEA